MFKREDKFINYRMDGNEEKLIFWVKKKRYTEMFRARAQGQGCGIGGREMVIETYECVEMTILLGSRYANLFQFKCIDMHRCVSFGFGFLIRVVDVYRDGVLVCVPLYRV